MSDLQKYKEHAKAKALAAYKEYRDIQSPTPEMEELSNAKLKRMAALTHQHLYATCCFAIYLKDIKEASNPEDKQAEIRTSMTNLMRSSLSLCAKQYDNLRSSNNDTRKEAAKIVDKNMLEVYRYYHWYSELPKDIDVGIFIVDNYDKDYEVAYKKIWKNTDTMFIPSDTPTAGSWYDGWLSEIREDAIHRTIPPIPADTLPMKSVEMLTGMGAMGLEANLKIIRDIYKYPETHLISSGKSANRDSEIQAYTAMDTEIPRQVEYTGTISNIHLFDAWIVPDNTGQYIAQWYKSQGYGVLDVRKNRNDREPKDYKDCVIWFWNPYICNLDRLNVMVTPCSNKNVDTSGIKDAGMARMGVYKVSHKFTEMSVEANVKIIEMRIKYWKYIDNNTDTPYNMNITENTTDVYPFFLRIEYML